MLHPLIKSIVYNLSTSPSEKELDRDMSENDIVHEVIRIQCKISNLSSAKRDHIMYQYRRLVKNADSPDMITGYVETEVNKILNK